MFGLADGAIGAAVKFIEYLEAAGPDWKKSFLARRREAYRAQRRLGTSNAIGKLRPDSAEPRERQSESEHEREPEPEREREPEPKREREQER
jgi:hypothetical protein